MNNPYLIMQLLMQRDELISHIRKLKILHGDLIDNQDLVNNMLNGSYKYLETNFDKIHNVELVDKNLILSIIKESIIKYYE